VFCAVDAAKRSNVLFLCKVCDVCGAFLVTNDSSDRLEAHYQGKQHQGYLKIRDTIEQMKVMIMMKYKQCTRYLSHF
jgi:hypothetical protein